MAFKFKQSSEGHGSNLALFTEKPVDAGIEQIKYVEYRPTSQVAQGSLIEFQISGSGMDYIDLQKMRLYVKARILRPDGICQSGSSKYVPPGRPLNKSNCSNAKRVQKLFI